MLAFILAGRENRDKRIFDIELITSLFLQTQILTLVEFTPQEESRLKQIVTRKLNEDQVKINGHHDFQRYIAAETT